MHRFFLPPTAIHQTSVSFPAETARQIRQVLRLEAGAQVTVLDGLGWEYAVQLNRVDREGVEGSILDRQASSGEPGILLNLCVSLSQREKFEWVLQKCTEVGAGRFTPVISRRSLIQDGEDASHKLPRWQKIVQEAAEQSGRGRIPALASPCTFRQVLAEIQASHTPGLILWERESQRSLAQALKMLISMHGGIPPSELAVFIGPEGGYEEEEIRTAQSAGLLCASLGPRILRMETAAVVSVALVLHGLGE